MTVGNKSRGCSVSTSKLGRALSHRVFTQDTEGRPMQRIARASAHDLADGYAL